MPDMPDFSRPFCYWIDISQEPPGPNKPGWIPSVVFEGQAGHYPMVGRDALSQPWYWGEDLDVARSICREQNDKLGLSPEEVDRIVASSIQQSIREEGGCQQALDRWHGTPRG